MRTAHRLALLTTILTAVTLVAGCSSDKPKTPTAPPASPVTPAPPAPPTPGASLSIATSSGSVQINSNDPVQITVTGQRTDNWTSLPDGTQVTVTTTLGGLGSKGGPTTVTLTLFNGRATTSLYAGTTLGTAVIRAEKAADATFGLAFAEAQVRFVEQAVTFVQAVVPSVGSPNGGEVVEIVGGGFEEPTRVTFGSSPAVVRSTSSSRITVETPRFPSYVPGAPFTPTPVAVAVVAAYGSANERQDTLSNGFTYSAGGGTLQPLVLSVTPASGPNEGGTAVVITGDGFDAPVQVFFGTVEAQVNSVTRTRIEAVSPRLPSPATSPTTVNIRVVNVSTGLQHTLVNAFRYGSALFISSFGPGQGPFTGGTLVTIYGQGFDEPVAASLGGYAQQVVSVSGTQVVVRTVPIAVQSCPSGNVVSSGPASVTNIETGEGADSGSAQFSYTIQKPQLYGVSPTSGPQGGGTLLALSGANFRTPVAVDFTVGGGTYAGSVQSITSCDADGYCTTVGVRTPAVPNSVFGTGQDCDDNNDGTIGKRWVPVNASIVVKSLETGCNTQALSNAFQFIPTDGSCRNDTAPPPAP
jgi:hypothetical protein